MTPSPTSRGSDEAEVAIVGTGPNGLAAGALLARSGLRVHLHEAAEEPGGGLRSARLFDSSVRHDICSAVHPMTASPFFRRFGPVRDGVRMHTPEISYAHPLEDGEAALAYRDLSETSARLGEDGPGWHRLMRPLLDHTGRVTEAMLSDLRRPPSPRAALLLAERMLRHGTPLPTGFRGAKAPALFAGVAAHAGSAPPHPAGAGVGLLLGHLAHAGGWPIPEGGSDRIAAAALDDLLAHGARVHTGQPIDDLRRLRSARAVLLDVAPRGLLAMAGELLPDGYRGQLERYRYGTAAAKADFLVSEPIPWRNPEISRAGTAHLGGTADRIRAVERATARGERVPDPFTLVSEPGNLDPTRAAPGKYPVWAYCHVPNGDTRDPVETTRRRIEHYAPGFSETVLESSGTSAARLEEYDANYPGGDISTGAVDLLQTLARPAWRLVPHSTPLRGVYLCSAATPPGPGVHGMCGYWAARAALRREFGVRELPPLD
ncbi:MULTISPECIES: NAD(P)/FAD-dependent oxidoreductase [unclassified Actinopolyspora]|uniref:phytoene desaturase family protein n=1 Tax=unclassified Actinopolyspora TaxID=2639451 RepID=UPI0013F65792|nr:MULTISPECIES: NAD(P)/FAD-dependent oxidoreductase [unclassified Actinopolyspora]NHD17542.1 NAD(P)/FAD-dependent oxidoreductase [Actinopolyspora sp. BKK2]NHE76725.1 NAD(P)/FAD-dependent oxidoreductase [Actinopolyspora sp. BKK1]